MNWVWKLIAGIVLLVATAALGGWIVFEPAPGAAMFMGDWILTDTEISPVIRRLIALDLANLKR